MLIRSTKVFKDDLTSVEDSDDKARFNHIQNVTEIVESNHRQRIAGTGAYNHSYGKEMEKIATVPISVFVERPELMRDEKALMKFLRSEEGAPWRVSRRRI